MIPSPEDIWTHWVTRWRLIFSLTSILFTLPLHVFAQTRVTSTFAPLALVPQFLANSSCHR